MAIVLSSKQQGGERVAFDTVDNDPKLNPTCTLKEHREGMLFERVQPFIAELEIPF